MESYDVIVIGAGHAGCEAAAASANLGCRTLLITMDMGKIAQMSCNPAMGGVAKGQIVREIDALGGYSGIITDRSTIQFRMLNRSKGPAMWSPRAQCDRVIYSTVWRDYLEKIPMLDFWQDSVNQLIIKNNTVKGVKTMLGRQFNSKTVIITSGTFMNGLMHIGNVNYSGGRASDMASFGISDQLGNFGFTVGRMKTGTPPRIDGRTVNFSVLEKQEGEREGGSFSFLPGINSGLNQLPCYIAYTNEKVHKILESGFDRSPLFSGVIKGKGPRYCPSIEDKIVTFNDKTRHQLFLEPEGESTIEYYINGFSSSLPMEIQIEALKEVNGLENVKIFRPGYAIEYDYFDPTQLHNTLETKVIANLYFAGQINGTTGYEEAAGQGLIAGINASNKVKEREPFVLSRSESYIGVLIDDLVTKGVDEPYRMFTSRAEYRLYLRQDNADQRLTVKGRKLGLVSDERSMILEDKLRLIDVIKDFLKSYSVSPDEINQLLADNNSSHIKQKVKLGEIVLRPQISIYNLYETIAPFKEVLGELTSQKKEALNYVEIDLKYRGYLEREKIVSDKIERLSEIQISTNFDYDLITSISNEAREKLKRIRPSTIGQASRISGVSPSDINVLLVYLGR